MPSTDTGSFRIDCSFCKESITAKQLGASVMIRVWSSKLGRYVGMGPLHAECGKKAQEQANQCHAAGES